MWKTGLEISTTLLLMQNSISRNNTIFTHLFSYPWFLNYLLLFIPRNYENSDCTFFTILRIVFFFYFSISRSIENKSRLEIFNGLANRISRHQTTKNYALPRSLCSIFWRFAYTNNTNNISRFPQLLHIYFRVSISCSKNIINRTCVLDPYNHTTQPVRESYVAVSFWIRGSSLKSICLNILYN